MAREFQHNTAEQVSEYLRRALALVEELDVPDDLRPHAFVKAVDLFSSKQVVYDPADVQPLAAPALDLRRH